MENIISKDDLASLDIIIGPMYAGKTSELLRRLNMCVLMGFRCLFVNHKLDNRSQSNFSTHNNQLGEINNKIKTIKLQNISECLSMIENYDIIGIDEGQLFKDLKEAVYDIVNNYGKKVIVSGLNGDFQMKKFGDIIDLIPFCENITKLNPFCLTCCQNGIIKPANFSKRIGGGDKIIEIGGTEHYIPVCRKCYNI